MSRISGVLAWGTGEVDDRMNAHSAVAGFLSRGLARHFWPRRGTSCDPKGARARLYARQISGDIRTSGQNALRALLEVGIVSPVVLGNELLASTNARHPLYGEVS